MIKLRNLLTEQKIGLIDTSNISVNSGLKSLDAEVAGYVKQKKFHSGCQDSVKFGCGLSGIQAFKLPARYSELTSGQDFLDAYKTITDKLKEFGPGSLGAAENKFLEYVDGHPWALKPVSVANFKKLVKIFKTILQFAPDVTPIKLTGGDDFYHRAYGKSGGGWHDDSIALDITFPFTPKNQEKVERIILHLMGQYPTLGFINEVAGYGKKSGKATGDHFHISFKQGGGREAARFAMLKDENGVRKKSSETDDVKLDYLRSLPFNKIQATSVDSDYATKYAEVTSAKILKDGRIDINYPMAHLSPNLGIKFELLYYPDAGQLGPIGGGTPQKIKFKNISPTITINMSRFNGKPNYGTSGKFNLGKYLKGLNNGVYQYIMNPINIIDRNKDIGQETISEKFIFKNGKVIPYSEKAASDITPLVGPRQQSQL